MVGWWITLYIICKWIAEKAIASSIKMPYYTIITSQMRSALDIYIYNTKRLLLLLPTLRCTRPLSLAQSLYVRLYTLYILNHENIPRFIVIILLNFARKRLVSIIIISGGSSTYPSLMLFSTRFHFRQSRPQNEDDVDFRGAARKPDKPCCASDIIIIIIRPTIFFRGPSRNSMHTHV